MNWIADQPDSTLQEMSDRFEVEYGMRVLVSTLDDWLRPTRSAIKKTATATEQGRSDVQAARAVWRKRQAWLKSHPEKLGSIVIIDETSLSTKMTRLRARAKKGDRLVASVPLGHWKTLTFIAGLRRDGVTAPWVIDGAMDGPAFLAHISTQLARALQKGDVVIMDSLATNKMAAAKKAIKERGAWPLFLPPYSPDFNPIELAFSKLKAHLKRLAPSTIEALCKDTGQILYMFRKQERQNYFAVDGYAPE
ncbi:MAG: IS630 family transposase [Kordiimonadaceae bacterium]|nr:IS630 family transposase [Kordiimonadaceae bacterium]